MLRTILFVDDDQILRTAVEQRLNDNNDAFGVITATDGFDAVQKLKTAAVSLVVLDLVMPRMDGVSLIAHLREHYPDLPIIIVSSLDEHEVQGVADRGRAHAYLTKPFQAADLAALIKEVLALEAEGGIMNDVSPPVFMQLMEMDARTCTIRILDNHSDRGGILYFNQGELFDARSGDVRGIEAAYRIFSWDRTTIFISNRCEATEDRIESNLGSIIMKAVGMKDEREDRPDDYDEQESIASLSDDGDGGGPAPGGGIGGGSDFASVKRRIEEIAGVQQVTGDQSKQDLVDRIARLGDIAGMGKLVLAGVESGKDEASVIVPTQPVGVVKSSRDVTAEVQQVLKG